MQNIPIGDVVNLIVLAVSFVLGGTGAGYGLKNRSNISNLVRRITNQRHNQDTLEQRLVADQAKQTAQLELMKSQAALNLERMRASFTNDLQEQLAIAKAEIAETAKKIDGLQTQITQLHYIIRAQESRILLLEHTLDKNNIPVPPRDEGLPLSGSNYGRAGTGQLNTPGTAG